MYDHLTYDHTQCVLVLPYYLCTVQSSLHGLSCSSCMHCCSLLFGDTCAVQVLSQGMDERDLPVYDEKVDIWSVGAVLFEAVTGFQPFLADSAADMAALISTRMDALDGRGVPEFISRHGLPAALEDFLISCFKMDPQQRPSAEQLLQHPWLLQLGGAGPAVGVAEQPSGREGVRRSLSLASGALEATAQTCMRSRTSRMVGTSSQTGSLGKQAAWGRDVGAGV
jgi:hypothetical protein